MSTTVNYKGSTIATLDNETKTLTTAGTWLEDDIEIVDVSSGSSLVIVDTPDAHGGTIREITNQSTVSLQTKTITPSGSEQVVTPDTGYDGFSSVTINGMGTHNLPSGYTEYEYIEGTGTQYINTGYVPTADTELIYKFERTESQSYYSCEYGVQPTPKLVSSGNYFSIGNQSDKRGNYNPDQVFGPFTTKVNTQGCFNLLGTKAVDFGTVTWTSGSLPLFVLARNNNGTAEMFSKEKAYYFCATENNVKKIELIPAMRTSDSVLGMYDTVSNTFLINAGTGTFVGGAL